MREIRPGGKYGDTYSVLVVLFCMLRIGEYLSYVHSSAVIFISHSFDKEELSHHGISSLTANNKTIMTAGPPLLPHKDLISF